MEGGSTGDARAFDQDGVDPAEAREPVDDRGSADASADDDSTRVRSHGFRVSGMRGRMICIQPRTGFSGVGLGLSRLNGFGRVALGDEVVDRADDDDHSECRLEDRDAAEE